MSRCRKLMRLQAACLFVGIFVHVAQVQAFELRTDCVGRFRIDLPGDVEVAMLVNKAFPKVDDDPAYPTDAVITFFGGYGKARYHFSDAEEGPFFTGGGAGDSRQELGSGRGWLETGPKADAEEFARFKRAMDSYFGKLRKPVSDFRTPDSERPLLAKAFDTTLPGARAWRSQIGVHFVHWRVGKTASPEIRAQSTKEWMYYLLWRDGRLFSYNYPAEMEVKPTLEYVEKHIRSREIFEVPKEQGLCLHQAFLPDDGTLPRRIAMTYRLKNHPEIKIHFADNHASDDNAPAEKKSSVDKIINEFWERQGSAVYAKEIKLISSHFPGIVHFPDVEIAGFKGKRSFVQITKKDGSLDYGYFAFVRGDPDAKEDRPDLMLYVLTSNDKATGKLLSKGEIEELANRIAASVKRR